jgi:hypothetical protein
MGVDSMPNESASGSGAAYVFVRSGTTWSQQAYLKASNQLVRYYGWYSNKMRGQRLKQDAQKEAERESAEGESPALGTPEVIDVSGFVSRRRPSRKWSEKWSVPRIVAFFRFSRAPSREFEALLYSIPPWFIPKSLGRRRAWSPRRG